MRATPRSRQERAVELLRLVTLALWLAKPSSITLDIIVHAFLNRHWHWVNASEVRRFIPHSRDRQAQLTGDDIELARKLTLVLGALREQRTVWSAVSTLSKALAESQWELRYVLLWIVIEALFGPEDTRETTFRTSQRVALFLANDGKEACEIFRTAKKGYACRSKIVHGMRTDKIGDWEQILHDTEIIVRKSIRQILTSPDLVRIWNGKKREEYLDNLPFR